MTDSLDRLEAALSDRYRVERELGRGGTATVFLATDLRHDRPVALKVLNPELAAAVGPGRFLQEIRTTARLTHPHILPLLDSGEAEGFLYCAMPYVEGESLRERLVKEKQLPLDDALRIARELTDALSYAHAQGVIHRDIKPENILLESGHAVVADFGIARAIDVAAGTRMTETGITLGTPAYMSPEQAAGERDLDGRSDLYSLGCVLYEMLAGMPPFSGPTAESLLRQHLAAEPPDVTTIRPSVPGWVSAALTRALAKTPADRFNPVALFAEVLAARASTADAMLPEVGDHRVRRSRFRITPARALTSAVFVAIAVIAGFLLFRSFAPAGLPADRVIVFPFQNRTGDASHERVADYAMSAIENGVGAIGNARLVPEETVLRAIGGDESDVRDIARRLGAGTAVTADVSVLGDSLRLGAQIIDVTTGDVIQSVHASGPTGDPRVVARDLSSRVVGALAVRLSDSRAGSFMTRPPSYESYKAYALAVERFWAGDYTAALEHYREAYRGDTAFVLALKGMASTYFMLGRYSGYDSIVSVMTARRSDFTSFGWQGVEMHRARLEGDLERSLDASREALRLESRRESAMPVIMNLRDTNRPHELLKIWGAYGGLQDSLFWSWWPIWYAVGNAQHGTEMYSEELVTARIGREMFPDRLSMRFMEARSLIGLGRLGEVTSVLEEVGRLEAGSPFTPPAAPGSLAESWSPGLLLTYAAWEMARHGHAEESLRMAERAVTWYGSRESQRFAMAKALLAAGRPGAAVEELRGSVEAAEAPGDVDVRGLFGVALARAGDSTGAEAEARWLESLTRRYLFGAPTYWRAAIAANLGEKDTAVRHLRTSFQQGQSAGFLHYDAHFAPLWGYEPFEDLIRPRG